MTIHIEYCFLYMLHVYVLTDEPIGLVLHCNNKLPKLPTSILGKLIRFQGESVFYIFYIILTISSRKSNPPNPDHEHYATG